VHRLRDEQRLFGAYSAIYLVCLFAVMWLSSGANPALDVSRVATSAMTAVGPAFLIVAVFKRYLWHHAPLKRLLDLRVPHIAGRWEGYLLSSLDQHTERVPVVLEFWQTVDRVVVWYYDTRAVTTSVVADFVFEAEGGPINLVCVYRNVPISSRGRLVEHVGVMQLVVDPSCRQIDGTYFNNPHERRSYGELHLEYKGRAVQGRFAGGT
jgi:hypothetical protein